MAIIGAFGHLSDTVVPDKGLRFNTFWETDIPPGAETLALGWTLPSAVGTPSAYVNMVHVTGRIDCIVTLKLDGAPIYRGRMDLVQCNMTDRFDDCEFVVAPGQTVAVYIEHGYPTILTFAGNLGGFRR